jgi:hypothetical protein
MQKVSYQCQNEGKAPQKLKEVTLNSEQEQSQVAHSKDAEA